MIYIIICDAFFLVWFVSGIRIKALQCTMLDCGVWNNYTYLEISLAYYCIGNTWLYACLIRTVLVGHSFAVVLICTWSSSLQIQVIHGGTFKDLSSLKYLDLQHNDLKAIGIPNHSHILAYSIMTRKLNASPFISKSVIIVTGWWRGFSKCYTKVRKVWTRTTWSG